MHVHSIFLQGILTLRCVDNRENKQININDYLESYTFQDLKNDALKI